MYYWHTFNEDQNLCVHLTHQWIMLKILYSFQNQYKTGPMGRSLFLDGPTNIKHCVKCPYLRQSLLSLEKLLKDSLKKFWIKILLPFGVPNNQQLSGTSKWSQIGLSGTPKRSKIWLSGTLKWSKIWLSGTPK